MPAVVLQMRPAHHRLTLPAEGVDVEVMTHFEEFRPYLRANNCCERTVHDRLSVLKGFARAHPTFPHVSAGEITAWLGRPGYAPWSRASYYGHLRSYFNFAMEYELVDADPMARLRRPKPGKCVPRPLKPEQVAAVLAGARPRVRAWLILALYAGLRAHEIAKIRGEDVDQVNIFILGKGGQGADVPCHPIVWALAQTMPKAGWWFPTQFGPVSATGHVTSLSVSTQTSNLFRRCGIEGSIHRCRHTYATRLLRAGANVRVVQTLMRHESLNSTMIYTAVDEDERRDAINLLAAA